MQGARVILEIPIVADVALSSIERSLLCISVSNKLMVFGFDNLLEFFCYSILT